MKTQKIICTSVEKGRRHDYYQFKKSKIKFDKGIECIADSAYVGIKKVHANSKIPKKNSKKNGLTKIEKKSNQEIHRLRVKVEHVIRRIKIFKIMSYKYRNRRKRYLLRLNLIAAFVNFNLSA